MNGKRILIIGYGNPGRLDDGLGPALAQRLLEDDIPGVTVEADYQLTVEDAHTVAQSDLCVFADAEVNGPEPFRFQAIEAAENIMSFTSHGVEPAQVLGLARKLFHKEVEGYILGIRGYYFNEFGEKLSDKARKNMLKAETFIKQCINEGSFAESVILRSSRN